MENSFLKRALHQLNLVKVCREYKVSLWECPQFLFVIMGFVIIVSILGTYFVGRLYADPMVVVVIIMGVTAVLFIMSYVVLNSFERIARTSKEKSEFISLMSHEMRNPLSSVKWQLDLLLSAKPEEPIDSKELKNALSAMSEQNHYMISIVNKLLEMNRFEAGVLALNPSKFFLGQLVREIVSKHTEKAAYMKINLVFFPAEEDFEVFADRDKIAAVLGHMIENAINYSHDAGKVTVSFEKANGDVRCSVGDEGIGIPETESKRIFSKFFRGETSKKYKTEGLGVGLYLVKTIVEANKGKVGFSSIEGRGSTFWFVLPVAK